MGQQRSQGTTECSSQLSIQVCVRPVNIWRPPRLGAAACSTGVCGPRRMHHFGNIRPCRCGSAVATSHTPLRTLRTSCLPRLPRTSGGTSDAAPCQALLGPHRGDGTMFEGRSRSSGAGEAESQGAVVVTAPKREYTRLYPGAYSSRAHVMKPLGLGDGYRVARERGNRRKNLM
jgi:hypothetical protein